MKGRREFIKKVMAAGTLPIVTYPVSAAAILPGFNEEALLKISPPGNGLYYDALEQISLDIPSKGKVSVMDSEGDVYFEQKAEKQMHIRLGGSLGNQAILLEDIKDRLKDVLFIPVSTASGIEDEKGEFKKLLDTLYRTMISTNYGTGKQVFFNGKYYTYLSSWFQDHIYAMKGMKYFLSEWKSGVDLYADGQREDGMIHDNYKHPYEKDGSWSWRFDYGNFVKIPEDPRSSCIFVRVPVENMAEFTFLEGLYYTWKTTADDKWMKSRLDNALKALHYATTDPYRWSEKFRLLKRGYTIDIWDFQTEEDAAIAGNDIMRVYPEKSRFGIMFGDNVRMAASCDYLAEMLTYAGREKEALRVKETGEGIRKRINDLSWNGEFYTHHIPEDPNVKRDLGVDESRQVVLSNAYALGAGINHDKAVAIIKTYQRIRNEKPKSALAEWYTCYPPFEKGFHVQKWNYMNGGITPIVAGELAHGAFEHGFEDYGVDILRRIYQIAQLRNDQLEGCYKGKIPEAPERTFESVNLRKLANTDLAGGNKDVPGFTGDPGNDMAEFPTGKQVFEDIPFEVIAPESNDRKAVLTVSGEPGFSREVRIPIKKKAGSVYFLHVLNGANMAGYINILYEDGSSWGEYIAKDKGNIGGWWFAKEQADRKGIPKLKLAWTGKNRVTTRIGCWVSGLNNPHPDKMISELQLEGMKDSTRWMILGMTLSNAPVFFTPSIVSTIPAHWGAAAVTYALMEGLCGMVDKGVSFNKAELAPRWSFAGCGKSKATAKYEASGGYLSYVYEDRKKQLNILFTGNSNETHLKIPLNGRKVSAFRINDSRHQYNISGDQKYLESLLEGKGVHQVTIDFA